MEKKIDYDVSVGFVVVNSDGEFLLLKKAVDGVWDFPKGHFNVGEFDELMVALREFEEETGISVKDLVIVDGFRDEHFFVNPKGSHRKIVAFLGLCDKSPVLSSEHSEFGWYDLDCACVFMRFPEKVALLKRAHAFLVDRLIL